MMKKIFLFCLFLLLQACASSSVFENNKNFDLIRSSSFVNELQLPPSYYLPSAKLENSRDYIDSDKAMSFLFNIGYDKIKKTSFMRSNLDVYDKKFLVKAGADNVTSNFAIRSTIDEETLGIITAKDNIIRKVLFLNTKNDETLKISADMYKSTRRDGKSK